MSGPDINSKMAAKVIWISNMRLQAKKVVRKPDSSGYRHMTVLCFEQKDQIQKHLESCCFWQLLNKEKPPILQKSSLNYKNGFVQVSQKTVGLTTEMCLHLMRLV
jgi:hypothetical protein